MYILAFYTSYGKILTYLAFCVNIGMDGAFMRIKFNVSGMTCAACSARVEKVTKAVEGVRKVDVNLLAGKMSVEASVDCTASIIDVFLLKIPVSS